MSTFESMIFPDIVPFGGSRLDPFFWSFFRRITAQVGWEAKVPWFFSSGRVFWVIRSWVGIDVRYTLEN